MLTLEDIVKDVDNGFTLEQIHKKYGGLRLYIPQRSPNYKDLVVLGFNGGNYEKLAHDHNTTVQNIKDILRTHKPKSKAIKKAEPLEGTFIISDNETLDYKNHTLSFKHSYTFDLAHLKAVYDVGIEELLKSEYLIGLEIPKGYTFNDFITQIKDDNVHTPKSLQEHLQSLLSDMVRLLEHTKEK